MTQSDNIDFSNRFGLAYIKVNSDGKILALSKVARADLGMSEYTNIENISFLDLLNDSTQFYKILNLLNSNENVGPVQIQLKGDASESVNVNFNYAPLFNVDNTLIGFDGVWEHKEVNSSINNLDFISLLPSCVLITRVSDGTIMEVSDTFIETLKIPKHELIGKTTKSLNLWPDSIKREIFIDELFAKGKIVEKEVNFSNFQDEFRSLLFSAQVFQYKGEKCMLVLTTDITYRKNLEISLLETNKLLEMYLYKNAHDVRGPLSRIMGLSELLLNSENATEQKALIQMIDQSAKELDTVVHNINDSLSTM